jgi:hypothetical protein
MYLAAVSCAKKAIYKPEYEWDFNYLVREQPDDFFVKMVSIYTKPILKKRPIVGWKLPETNLAYPWIVKMFPDAYYIHWVRDPRDVILGSHLTDNLKKWGIPFEGPTTPIHRRAVSWKFQWDIVESTPKPKRFLRVKLEDFNNEKTIAELGDFLDLSINPIEFNEEVVGRWKRIDDPNKVNFTFLQPAIQQAGYES